VQTDIILNKIINYIYNARLTSINNYLLNTKNRLCKMKQTLINILFLKSYMKKEVNIINLFLRYSLIIILGLWDLFLFYKTMGPLTRVSVFFILNLFSQVPQLLYCELETHKSQIMYHLLHLFEQDKYQYLNYPNDYYSL